EHERGARARDQRTVVSMHGALASVSGARRDRAGRYLPAGLRMHASRRSVRDLLRYVGRELITKWPPGSTSGFLYDTNVRVAVLSSGWPSSAMQLPTLAGQPGSLPTR